MSVYVHRGSPSSSNVFNRAVQKGLMQPISETSSPDKVLFIYFEQVNKLAPKQQAVFQNRSSKKSRQSDFRDCGFTVVLLSAVSVFQGALSDFQPPQHSTNTHVFKEIISAKDIRIKGIFQTFFFQVSLNSKNVTNLQKNLRSVGHEFSLLCFVWSPTQ